VSAHATASAFPEAAMAEGSGAQPPLAAQSARISIRIVLLMAGRFLIER
jgi:hypothetical protein